MNASEILAPTKFNMLLSQHGEYGKDDGRRNLRLQEEYQRLHDAYGEVQLALRDEMAMSAKLRQKETGSETGLAHSSIAESNETDTAQQPASSGLQTQLQDDLWAAMAARIKARHELDQVLPEARALARVDQMQVAKQAADKLIDEAKRAAAQIIQEAKAQSEPENTAPIGASKQDAAGGDNGSENSSAKEPPALTADELSRLWTELRPASSPQYSCSPWQVRFDFMASDDKAEIEAAVARAQTHILGPRCPVAIHIVEIRPIAVTDTTSVTKTANALIVVLSPAKRGRLSVLDKLLMNQVHDVLLKGSSIRKRLTGSNQALQIRSNFDFCFGALTLQLSKSKQLTKAERALCPRKHLVEPPAVFSRAATQRWVDGQLGGMLVNCPNFQDRLARIKGWCQRNLETFRAMEVIETPEETLQHLMKVVLERDYLQAQGDAKIAVRGALMHLHQGNLKRKFSEDGVEQDSVRSEK